MREIIFRGKRVDNGEWVYGDLINDKKFRKVSISDMPYSLEGLPVWVAEVYPSTIGQYTGLKDKHGKMIFEGDIVIHNNTHYTVEFSRTQLGFVCMDRKHKTRGGWPNWRDGQWMQNVSKYLEVIGNLHEQEEDV